MISIEQLANGRWRWSFREPARNVELVSNEDYDDAGAARAAAEIAYPGVHIEQHGRGETGTRRKRADRRRGGTEGGGITGKLERKVAGWLTPVVILIAWSRSKQRR